MAIVNRCSGIARVEASGDGA